MAGGRALERLDTGQTVVVYVQNITNYNEHIAGAPATTEQLGPLVFRRYEQRYQFARAGLYDERMTYKARCVGGAHAAVGVVQVHAIAVVTVMVVQLVPVVITVAAAIMATATALSRTFFQFVSSQSSPRLNMNAKIITPNPSWSLTKKKVLTMHTCAHAHAARIATLNVL